jgi:hypothetical protein
MGILDIFSRKKPLKKRAYAGANQGPPMRKSKALLKFYAIVVVT